MGEREGGGLEGGRQGGRDGEAEMGEREREEV